MGAPRHSKAPCAGDLHNFLSLSIRPSCLPKSTSGPSITAVMAELSRSPAASALATAGHPSREATASKSSGSPPRPLPDAASWTTTSQADRLHIAESNSSASVGGQAPKACRTTSKDPTRATMFDLPPELMSYVFGHLEVRYASDYMWSVCPC